MLVNALTACGAACAALLYLRALHAAGERRITRLGAGPHFSHVVIHGGTAYLAGVTAQADGNGLTAEDTVEEQTARTLAVIEKRLALAGTDKSRLLTCQGAPLCQSTRPRPRPTHAPDHTRTCTWTVWLKDIARDYKAMNEAYSAWVDGANKPIRATVQSPMASPHMLVEIQVTAAVP